MKNIDLNKAIGVKEDILYPLYIKEWDGYIKIKTLNAIEILNASILLDKIQSNEVNNDDLNKIGQIFVANTYNVVNDKRLFGFNDVDALTEDYNNFLVIRYVIQALVALSMSKEEEREALMKSIDSELRGVEEDEKNNE